MKLTRLAEDQVHPWLDADPPSWEWPVWSPVLASAPVGWLRAIGIRIRLSR